MMNQLEQKTFKELKTIAHQLNAKPTGSLKQRQTWEAAIINQAQKMELSIDAVTNPILRTYCLGGRDGCSTETIEAALELVERHCYASLFRNRPPIELTENSPATQLAAKVLPGILGPTKKPGTKAGIQNEG